MPLWRSARNLLVPASSSGALTFLTLSLLATTLNLWDRAEQWRDRIQGSRMTTDHFDFIIVGAGTAGSVVASRLSEKYSVLLLEAGGKPFPGTKIPAATLHMQRHKAHDWNFRARRSEACLACEHGEQVVSAGKMLGGSSALGFNMWSRGHFKDYETWFETTGDSRWNYKSLSPFFDKAERQFSLGAEESSGTSSDFILSRFLPRRSGRGGDIRVPENGAHKGPAVAFLEAARGLTDDVRLDFKSAKFEQAFGMVYYPMANGRRLSAYDVYVKPVRRSRSARLTVVKYAEVSKVLFEPGMSKKAIGVEFIRHGKPHQMFATKEVVLSAGALQSPRLLILSGIGPRRHLEDLKIPVRVDSPGVGANLQDFESTYIGPFISKKTTSGKTSVLIDRDIRPRDFLDWTSRGVGTLTSAGLPALGFLKSNRSVSGPDIQYVLNSCAVHTEWAKTFAHAHGIRKPVLDRYVSEAMRQDSFFVLTSVVRPRRRGQLKLRTSSPAGPLDIQLRSLENIDDLKVAVEATKTIVDFIESSPTYNKHQTCLTRTKLRECSNFPLRSDQYWECYWRHLTISRHNYVGTCSMGLSDAAVVDSELRVKGTTGLRVIDASVAPSLPVGGTFSMAVMVGERGAKFILDEWSGEGGVSPKPKPITSPAPKPMASTEVPKVPETTSVFSEPEVETTVPLESVSAPEPTKGPRTESEPTSATPTTTAPSTGNAKPTSVSPPVTTALKPDPDSLETIDYGDLGVAVDSVGAEANVKEGQSVTKGSKGTDHSKIHYDESTNVLLEKSVDLDQLDWRRKSGLFEFANHSTSLLEDELQKAAGGPKEEAAVKDEDGDVITGSFAGVSDGLVNFSDDDDEAEGGATTKLPTSKEDGAAVEGGFMEESTVLPKDGLLLTPVRNDRGRSLEVTDVNEVTHSKDSSTKEVHKQPPLNEEEGEDQTTEKAAVSPQGDFSQSGNNTDLGPAASGVGVIGVDLTTTSPSPSSDFVGGTTSNPAQFELEGDEEETSIDKASSKSGVTPAASLERSIVEPGTSTSKSTTILSEFETTVTSNTITVSKPTTPVSILGSETPHATTMAPSVEDGESHIHSTSKDGAAGADIKSVSLVSITTPIDGATVEDTLFATNESSEILEVTDIRTASTASPSLEIRPIGKDKPLLTTTDGATATTVSSSDSSLVEIAITEKQDLDDEEKEVTTASSIRNVEPEMAAAPAPVQRNNAGRSFEVSDTAVFKVPEEVSDALSTITTTEAPPTTMLIEGGTTEAISKEAVESMAFAEEEGRGQSNDETTQLSVAQQGDFESAQSGTTTKESKSTTDDESIVNSGETTTSIATSEPPATEVVTSTSSSSSKSATVATSTVAPPTTVSFSKEISTEGLEKTEEESATRPNFSIQQEEVPISTAEDDNEKDNFSRSSEECSSCRLETSATGPNTSAEEEVDKNLAVEGDVGTEAVPETTVAPSLSKIEGEQETTAAPSNEESDGSEPTTTPQGPEGSTKSRESKFINVLNIQGLNKVEASITSSTNGSKTSTSNFISKPQGKVTKDSSRRLPNIPPEDVHRVVAEVLDEARLTTSMTEETSVDETSTPTVSGQTVDSVEVETTVVPVVFEETTTTILTEEPGVDQVQNPNRSEITAGGATVLGSGTSLNQTSKGVAGRDGNRTLVSPNRLPLIHPADVHQFLVQSHPKSPALLKEVNRTSATSTTTSQLPPPKLLPEEDVHQRFLKPSFSRSNGEEKGRLRGVSEEVATSESCQVYGSILLVVLGIVVPSVF